MSTDTVHELLHLEALGHVGGMQRVAIRAAHGRSNGRCAARAPAGQLPGALLLVPLAPPAERGVLVQRDGKTPEWHERDEYGGYLGNVVSS